MGEVQRYISSSFWSDDWVDSLPRDGKLLYMYLLTNECTNIAGVYKITLKRMKDDTGIPREVILELLETFEQGGKAFYFNEFMILPKWPKHQRIGERSTLLVGMYAVLRGLPNEIKVFLCSDPTHYYYDLSKVFGNFKQLSGRIDDSKKPIDDQKKGIDDTEKPALPGQTPEKGDRLSHDSDLDLDLDLDLDSDLDSDFKESNGGSNLKVPGEEENTTTFSISKIQEEVKTSTGYFIDERVASRFQNSKIPEEWIPGQDSFFAYAKAVVQEKYPGKPESEKRTLFITAVTDWANLREEYPSWKAKREKKASSEKIERAKTNRPTQCDCGGEIKDITGKLVCMKCNSFFVFTGGRYSKLEHMPEAHIDLGKIRSHSGGKQAEKELKNESLPVIPDF